MPTPSSVAFSIAHSKASNFTMERSSVISTAGACAGISSKQREFNAIARDVFDATKPNRNAVAQFVELTRLGTQHATEMMGRVAVDDGGTADELFNEEASPHGKILAHNA